MDDKQKQLYSVVESILSDEFEKVHNRASKQTICLRILKRVMDLDFLQISWSMVSDISNMIYLEQNIARLIESCWNSQVINESNCELEKILSRDYIKSADMLKFVNLLYRREMKQSKPFLCKIYKILGMDGFLGQDIKRYVEYLRYPSDDYKGVHVTAVREVYEYVTDFDKVYTLLCSIYAFNNIESENEFDLEIKRKYIELVGDNLNKIIEWKIQQKSSSVEDNKHKRVKRLKKNDILITKQEPNLSDSDE